MYAVHRRGTLYRLFFVGSESGVAHEWLIKDGKLLESDASNKYVYLDA